MEEPRDESVKAEWLEKGWSDVFAAVVEGVKQPPEEPTHKAIRMYGIFCSEMSLAQDNLDSSFADAGYVAADVLSAAETIELMVKEKVLPAGILTDVKQAVAKIEDGKEFGKSDCEDAINSILNMSDKILDAVVSLCSSRSIST